MREKNQVVLQKKHAGKFSACSPYYLIVGQGFKSPESLKMPILYLRFLTSKFRAMQSKKPLKIKGFSGQYLFYRPVMVAGVGFEPHDLRVMSPTSYQAALPRDIGWKWLRFYH